MYTNNHKLPSSIDPSSNGSLQYENLLGKNSITLLFQEQVVSVLKEHLSVTELVVGATQHHLADLRSSSSAISLEKLKGSLHAESIRNYNSQCQM